MEDKLEEGRKVYKVFSQRNLKMNVPSNIFYFGVVAGVLSPIILKTWFGTLLVVFLYFPAMLFMHKDDPDALRIMWVCWSDKKNKWAAGFIERISINIKE